MNSSHARAEDFTAARRPIPATKSAPAFKKNDQHKASFLDLPAEIRNDVYLYALEIDKRIPIKSCQGRLFMRDLKDGNGVPKVSIELLKVCKLIHFEATPVFYGNNRFTMANCSVSRDFTLKLGSAIRHLGNVRLNHIQVKLSFTAATNRLRKCSTLEKLEKLELDYAAAFIFYSPKQLATKMTPLLKGVRKARNESGDERPVKDIVEILPNMFSDKSDEQVYIADFKTALQKMVK